jgi:phage head maturation protease
MQDTKIYAEIMKTDDEKRMVYGYASTETLDSQEEKVSKDAVADALTDYMKWANIREMHQPSAVGVAKEAEIDDKGLYVVAKVVDDDAWNKVKEGVYKGFSLGGKKVAKVQDTITALKLTEISLVDRPANPDCKFDVWKAEGIEEVEKVAEREDVKPEEGKDKYGDVKFADEKNKKYPIDTEEHIRAAWNYINKEKNAAKYSAEDVKSIKGKIVSAWKDKIDKEGPPSAKEKEAEKVENPELIKAQEDLKKYAGQEIYDSQTAMSALSTVYYLLITERQEMENQPEQVTLLETVVKNLKAFIASEILEDHEEALAMAEKTEDLQKAGARNSKGDFERIQGIHDHSVSLGADCSSKKAEGADDLQKVHNETLDKVTSLETELTKVQGEKETLEKRVKELEAQPAPAKGVLKVVEKGQDISPVTEAVEPVKKSDGSENDVATEIKKIHRAGGKRLN